MYLGEKPVVHCSECKKVIDGLYWTVTDAMRSIQDPESVPSDVVEVKTLCDRDFTLHIAEQIRKTVDPSFQMGVRQMYDHIYGPATWYHRDKMRVLLNAIGIVIEENEFEKEKKDGEV